MRQELDIYIRARYPLLYVVTAEEERALAEIQKLADESKTRKQVIAWSCTEGFVNQANGRKDQTKRDPLVALNSIMEDSTPTLVILRDFHPFFENHEIVRKLRDLAQALQKGHRTVILLSPVLRIPPELEKEITVIDFSLPNEAELNELYERAVQTLEADGKARIQLDRRERERLAKAALGLTLSEAEKALAKAIIMAGGRLDGRAVEAVIAEKKQIIRKSGLLEFYDTSETLTDVGGLDVLKEWLRKRVRAFSAEARAFGLPEPRGILLVGVQGSGKSLMAKAVANAWRLPLLRLDVGRLFASLVGSSEENLRTAIRVAESIAPCLLWVDEIEKGFSGVGSSNVSDAGTAARVFGSFVTWLQEKKAPVFVVATANLVDQLPPELVRKGRFDEIFFVDLPMASEREDIFRIHLRKRNRDPQQFDVSTLAMSSEGLSGAEIEQAVVAGLYEAFDEGRPLATDDMISVLAETIPLSQMMEETVNALRAWAKHRARPASSQTRLF